MKSSLVQSLALLALPCLALTFGGCLVVSENTSTQPRPQPTAVAATSVATYTIPAGVEITPSRIEAFPANAKVTSTVIDTTKVAMRPQPYGAQGALFSGPSGTLENFESHMTTVNPGMSSHGPHMHPHEEMLIVKEGTLEVTIDGKTYIATPGSIIFYAPKDPHGTKNIGNVPATYYVFSWRTDQTPRPLGTTSLPSADHIAN